MVKRTLDSLVLHELLTSYKDGIYGYANVAVDVHEANNQRLRTIPAFVFHLSTDEALLLDGR